ncbi:hypothetical protein JTE90_021703 [Oedothorax gibbosus]|uniref:Uncharacterized protein n=1 Tax=Oedothorax gibbosus TaxID=931172 RepID=A0AAV6TRK6_9ARAC|nr:hypothetical protein JTE90_021703 [Oedothorax gibbosus]
MHKKLQGGRAGGVVRKGLLDIVKPLQTLVRDDNLLGRDPQVPIGDIAVYKGVGSVMGQFKVLPEENLHSSISLCHHTNPYSGKN